MGYLVRMARGIIYILSTLTSQMHWKGSLTVEGILQKNIDTQIIIIENGIIRIHKNVCFQRNVSLSSVGGMLDLGNNVAFNRNCIVICRKKIIIGDDVIIGPGVTIYDHDHIFSQEGILPGYKCDDVVIENGCWIGANVTILKGTHIGEKSVIGAGCVIKGNIPPHSLVTGDRNLVVKKIESRDRI